jgi:hypothetical protein
LAGLPPVAVRSLSLYFREILRFDEDFDRRDEENRDLMAVVNTF